MKISSPGNRYMAPPPPTKTVTAHFGQDPFRPYAAHNEAQLPIVFMVLGVSYLRVLAQRPTGCAQLVIMITTPIVYQEAHIRN